MELVRSLEDLEANALRHSEGRVDLRRARRRLAEMLGGVLFVGWLLGLRRLGTAPEALVTFRNLERIRNADIPGILARYPRSVQEHVERLSR